MNKLTLFSVYNAMESLTRQLLATPSRLYAPCKVYHWLSCQSMLARHPFSAACSCAALPFASMQKPTGEGTSNRLDIGSSNIYAALKRVFKKAKFTDFVELEVVL